MVTHTTGHQHRVFLHVGLMKSGTTFLQGRLNANRDALAAQGILFPGPHWGRHARAVSDLIGGRGAKAGAWESLRTEINDHPGDAIVSMEYLGPIGKPLITAARDSFPDRDVQAIVTVRDVGRSVPAMWQEALKNRQSWTWQDYLSQLESGDEAGRRFWRQQDAGRIVSRWAKVLGAGSVTVVTVPPPGSPSEELWTRFRTVTGIADQAEWAQAPRNNESLGVASALMLYHLNQATSDLSPEAYKKQVKRLAKKVLVQHRGQEEPIGFTVPRWLEKRSARMIRQIAASKVRVVGDLAELQPLNSPGANPSEVRVEEQLTAAVWALAQMLQRVERIG